MLRLTRTLVATAAIALVGFVSPAKASPITYVQSGIASGTLGASVFANALVTLTLTGDTSGVAIPPGALFPNTFLTNLGTGTVNIAGLGTATITDPVAAYASVNSVVPPAFLGGLPFVLIGTWDNALGTSITGILATADNALLGYDLKTSIGPVSGIGFSGTSPFAIHNTTMGVLNFTDDAHATTFTARTSAAAVPEPTSMLLFGTGVVSLIAARVRRRPKTSQTRG